MMSFFELGVNAHDIVRKGSQHMEATGKEPEDLVLILSLAAEVALVAATKPGPEREALRRRVAETIAMGKDGFESMDRMEAALSGN